MAVIAGTIPGTPSVRIPVTIVAVGVEPEPTGPVPAQDLLDDATSVSAEDLFTDDDDGPKFPSTFSTADKNTYNQIVDFVLRHFKDQLPGVTRTSVGSFVNAWAHSIWKNTVRFDEEGNPLSAGQWPGFYDLTQNPAFLNGVQNLALQGVLPEVFMFTNDDGSNSWMYMDPLTGMTDLGIGSESPEALRHLQDISGGRFDQQSLTELIAQAFGSGGGGGGGRRRGGGGGGRAAAVFDREQLLDQATMMWRAYLIQDPADEVIGAVVDDYMAEANAFWQGQGGRLDFETFVRGRIEGTPRYKYLTVHKPDEVEWLQFLDEYTRPLSQLGLGAGATLEQLERSVMSGGSPAGQTRRVTRTRAFQSQPGFSSRLAQTIQGLGRGVGAG